MNDKEIILSALKKPNPGKRKVKYLQEFGNNGTCFIDDKTKRYVVNTPEDMLHIPKDDPITKEAKRQARSSRWKKKTTKDWNMSDFARFAKSILNLHNVTISLCAVEYNSTIMSRIYDSLAKQIENMNNYILKEYLEWWVSVYAHKYVGEEIRFGYLSHDNHINKFSRYYEYNDSCTHGNTCDNSNTEQLQYSTNKDMSNQELYDKGITLLLINKGIIETYYFLTDQKTPNILEVIKKEIGRLSKELLIETLKNTTFRKTYSRDDIIDFMSLSRSALHFHSIHDFDNIDYKTYFK